MLHIYPLQEPRENLKIREDGCGGVFVEGLSEHIVRDSQEIMVLIQRGTRLRATNATRMNKVYDSLFHDNMSHKKAFFITGK